MRLGRADGQILPGLVMLLLAIIALGVIGFQVGKAAILRSQAQTAADAAALAGAHEIKRQLELQWAMYGTTDVDAIDDAAVVREMAEYADKNGARLDPRHAPEINAADVRVWVVTEERLGADARGLDSEDTDGEARARAALSLGVPSFSVGTPGAIGAVPPGGTPRISDDEWDDVAKKIDKPPGCAGVITLGLFLKAQGFQVWQNAHPALGGDQGHADNPTSQHHACGGMGALDVNFGACGPLCPMETAAIDPIVGPIQELGFFTIWRDGGDHDDHIHIDARVGGGAIGLGGGTGGFAGSLEEAPLEVRLVDWDAEIDDLMTSGPWPTTSELSGPPDLKIVDLMCQMGRPYGNKILLALFETAIVESGVHNLDWGSENSHGYLQQQFTEGWGTLAETMHPPTATQMFLDAAVRVNRAYPYLSAGQLAAEVQNPLESLRGRYQAVEGQAQALIARHC
jgi:Putative Flp pilus-assembly TadE/G-like